MTRDASIEFGKYLRRLREERELSTRALARKAELDVAGLVRLEQGKTSARPNTLRALASALEVPSGELFAAAGYLTPSDLPSMSTYLRVCYSDLSDQAVASIDEYVKRLINERGLNPSGPAPFEDETESPSRE